MNYTITLPRGVKVDVFNLPEDFDRIVLKCFAEYTKGTSKDYRDVDRLRFMYCFVNHLNGDKSAEDLVNMRIKELMAEAWDDGELLKEDDIYCVEFMEECCQIGMDASALYSQYGIIDHHIYDEINKVVARAMKIVSNATEEDLKEVLNE